MKENSLFINLEYNLDKDTHKIRTNVRKDLVYDTISTFLSTQIGQGADEKKANERKIYHIKIGLDLSLDTFTVSDNTGNKGLRDGILLEIVKRKESGRKY